MSTTFSLNNLNPEQQKAVTTQSSGVLVIAGAGSGKTRVITSRIAYLITERKTPPEAIIGLTFTNKAANEMKERIHSLIPDHFQMPFVGTFHSYCLFLLRKYRRITNLETFSILDSDDQRAMLKRLLEKYSVEKRITATQLQYAISCLKNQMTRQVHEHSMNNLIQQISIEYEKEKARSNVLDFDDLLIKILDLFKTSQEFKHHFQNTVKHILVDEYQDTNVVQHALLKQMALKPDGILSVTSVCAVGDEDQSIYSWRGAQVENMRHFKEDFAPVEIIKIEQNYRSAEPILIAANQVIAQNRGRTPKNLWSTRKATNRILLATCASGYQEADLIENTLTNLPSSITQGNVAILYRTHAQSRVLEEMLLRAGIPYTIIGGIRFYERKEIKDIFAFLRLIANPHDRVSLLRVLNVPARGLGEKIENLLLEEWDKNPELPFTVLIKQVLANKQTLSLSKGHERGLLEFIEVFEAITPQTNICKLYEVIIERIDYLSYLAAEYEREEHRTKSENLRELYHSMAFFEKKYADQGSMAQETQLQSFLAEVALLQEKIDEDTDNSNSVKLMTLHSAKGLEFNLVIIAGLEESILPSSKSLDQKEDLEEERRLFYVGITRAREYLLITHALMRSTYGQRVTQDPSRFLHDLPEQHIISADISNMYQNEIGRTVNRWFGNKYSDKSTHSFGLDLESTPHFITAASRPKQAPPGRLQATSTTKKPSQTRTNQIFSEPSQTKPEPIVFHALEQEACPFRINQKVRHATFGQGTIVSVDRKNTDETYLLSVNFSGTKKMILSSFLTTIS